VLHLIESEEGLWDRFQRDAAYDSNAPVVSRWTRARDLGARADTKAHPIGVRGHELASLRDAALSCLAEGNGVIDALESAAAARGLLAIVADPTGVIVRVRGGDALGAEAKRTRLVEGVRWDEGARGTNAIGTAIAERQPVAVVGRAHFESVNHGLFCYAAPVLDAFGDLVAAIDVTGPVERDEPALALAVNGATTAIQQLLRARAYSASEAGSLRLMERVLERCNAPAVLVEAPGVVRVRNAAAATELGLRADAPAEKLFGVGWNELASFALAGSASFETRRKRWSVEFEPVMSGGRVLALACFFESAAPRAIRVARTVDADAPMHAAFDRIFARDASVIEAKRVAAKLASTEVPVLLLAETGTGKELFAQAIHRASKRVSGPLVAVNCGALTSGLLESELFGHAPGAFTGAAPRGADGKIAAAHKGTLFLDEVGEMSPAAQAMLLRFLEDGSFTRVGEAQPRTADVRIVCATCRDLPELVRDGKFRQDLLFRIHGGCVRLPPLRDRTDRVELASHLLASVAPGRGLGHSAEAWVLDHSWPGNVRELKAALAYAVAMQESGTLEREHFPEPILTGSPGDGAGSTRRTALRQMAEDALSRASGNVSEAARILGVARSTLYRMLGR
jgi:transcriptional regulator of acetoin/glycerol metabolism